MNTNQSPCFNPEQSPVFDPRYNRVNTQTEFRNRWLDYARELQRVFPADDYLAYNAVKERLFDAIDKAATSLNLPIE